MQVGHLAGRGAARIDHDDLQLGPRFLDPARCAGTGSDGTTRCSIRPARSGRRVRGPRSTPARGLRRTPACAPPPPTTCTGANWCRCSRCRYSPSSACWRRSSPRSAVGRRRRTRPNPGRARSMIRRKPPATVSSASLHDTSRSSPLLGRAAADAAGVLRDRPFRRAPSPSSTGGRHWPDGVRRRQCRRRHPRAASPSTPQPTPQ